MPYKIREAIPDDAKAIARVHIASWRAAYTGIVDQEWLDDQSLDDRENKWRENLNQEPDKQQKTFVAFNDEVLAGFATAGASRDPAYPDYAELWAIYVDPDIYGKGAGRALFQACKQHARDLNSSQMFVNVLADNPLGRNFYERIGAVLIPESAGEVTLGNKKYVDIKYEWKDLEL